MGSPRQAAPPESELAFCVQVLARERSTERKWAGELARALAAWMRLEVSCFSDAEHAGTPSLGIVPFHGDVIFVDADLPQLERRLGEIDREGKAIFLVTDADPGEPPAAPAAWIEGLADDVLVRPFRPLEVLSRLRQYQRMRDWQKEWGDVRGGFQNLAVQMKADLAAAEALQKRHHPARFPEVKGFKAMSRYLAGMKSGGDHLDLAESRDGQSLSIVLTDSSSYGLSSALTSALMRVAARLSVEDARSCGETVRRIQAELQATLTEKDRFSVFYGVVSRKDYRLRYVHRGDSVVAYAAPGEARFRALPAQGGPLGRASAEVGAEERVLTFEPGGRLALLSDGFVEAAGSVERALEVLASRRDQDARDSLNELVYRVKHAFQSEDDMPAQDCTALILDVDARVIRLA